MYKPEDILEGARSIRPYLKELLGADADSVDGQLADLLASAQAGRKVDNSILELLASQEATREWMAKFLEHKRPLEVERLYTKLPGNMEPVPVSKYKCPKGDYVWYRRTVGEEVPECPTHHIELVPVDESEEKRC